MTMQSAAEVIAEARYREAHPLSRPVREHSCAECQDTGEYYGPHTDWERAFCDCERGRSAAHEDAEFQARVKQEQAEARQAALEASFGRAGLSERHKSLTVDDLADGRARNKAGAIKAVQAMREAGAVHVRGGEKNSLVLYGPVGTGKTAMITEVARCWLSAGKVVLAIQYNQFIASVQATYGNGGDWQRLVNSAVNCDLLVMDDMGDPDGRKIRAESPDRREKVFLIVNERYNRDRPVVMATNLDKSQFRQAFGERITDRLEDMAAWVKVGGPNLRRM